MHFLVWSGLFSFLANLGIGLFVLSRDPKKAANRWFALFCLAVSGWSVGSFLENIISSHDLALKILRINYAFAIWLPWIYIRYVDLVTQSVRRVPSAASAACLGLSAIFSLFVFTRWMIPDFRLIDGWYRISMPGPVYFAFFAYFAAVTGFVVTHLLSATRTASNETQTRFKYLSIANVCAIVAGFEYFSRVFEIIDSPPLDDFVLIIYVAILAYAMLKHGLLDAGLFIKRTAYYSMFAFIVSMLYVAVIFISHGVITGTYGVIRPNPFTVSNFLIALTSLSFGIFVLAKDPRRRLNQLWFIMNMSIFLWGSWGMLLSLVGSGHYLFYWRLCYVTSVVWIPVFFLHFVCEYLNTKKRLFLWISYAITFITCYFVLFTDLFFGSVRLVFNAFYYAIPATILPAIQFGWWLFCYSYALVLLLVHIHKADKGRRRELTYIFLALGIAGLGGSTNFLPLLGIDLYPWGNFAVPLYPIMLSYAIWKYAWLDIRVVVKRTLFYSFFVLVLSLLYVAAVFLAHRFIAGGTSARSVVANVSALVFIACIFKPVESFLQRNLEKHFFKGSIEEISAQKDLLETELERRERLKSIGILAAGMAHEIKNPLTAISTFVEYLPQKYQDPQFLSEFQRIVRGEIGRIQNIVQDLLDFSKPRPALKETANLNQIIRDVLTLLSKDFLAQGVSTSLRPCPGAESVQIDTAQMKQALLNIIMNSLDAMKQKGGGQLDIAVNQLPDGISIEVTDTGCGIGADKIERIFDPFYTQKDMGTGLGLAITHSIIEQHRGKIRVHSRIGEGTKVIIILPA